MKGTDQLWIREHGDGAILAVKAVPGSSRDRIAGVLGESLKVCVAAAAEKGKANAAIAAVLADALEVPVRNVTLVSSPTSPRKEFLVVGLSAAQLRQRIEKL